MTRFLPMTFGFLLLVVIIIVIVDAVTEPAGAGCVLDTNILLPDRCIVPGCSAQDGDNSCPALTTRPYMFFGTEAATCDTRNFLCPITVD